MFGRTFSTRDEVIDIRKVLTIAASHRYGIIPAYLDVFENGARWLDIERGHEGIAYSQLINRLMTVNAV